MKKLKKKIYGKCINPINFIKKLKRELSKSKNKIIVGIV